MKHPLTIYKVQVFIVTFCSYITYHCSRTVWSYNQKYIQKDINSYNENMTGYANLCFLFTYGICMKMFGVYGANFNLKYSVAAGSFLAGGSLILMAVLGLTSNLTVYMIFIIMIINGAGQSSGWPCLVAIMGNWYKGRNIGLLMGIWSGNSNVGDIIGLLIGDIIVQRSGLSCYYGLLIAGIAFWCSALLMLTIHVSPDDVPIKTLSHDKVLDIPILQHEQVINRETRSQEIDLDMQTKNITFFNAWKLPGVLLYVLGFVCLKGTFLGFLFWLPSYFQSIPELEKQSSYISQMFDYGTFLGGIIIGYLGDKFKMRAVFMCPSLLIAAGLMIMIKYLLGTSALPYYLIVFGIGIFQGGPYNTISGAIVIELSNTPELQGNKKATRLVSSIIEGTGTLGGALFQVVIPIFGSDQLFLIFTVVTFLGAFVTLVIMFKEIQRKKRVD